MDSNEASLKAGAPVMAARCNPWQALYVA